MTNQTPDDALEAAMKMATKWEDAVHLVNDRGYNPATEVRAFRELEAAVRHAQDVAARYAVEEERAKAVVPANQVSVECDGCGQLVSIPIEGDVGCGCAGTRWSLGRMRRGHEVERTYLYCKNCAGSDDHAPQAFARSIDSAFTAMESALRGLVPEDSTSKMYAEARAALALAEGVRGG